jgi:phytoene desaturase
MNKTGKGRKAIIIGSGVGGLATAVRLANRGFDVTVLEKNATTGGKIQKIEKDGFTWGFGASLFTFPELLSDVFRECGRDPEDYYKVHRLDPICNYFYEDGTRLSSYAEPEKCAEEIQNKTGEPAKNVIRYLRKIAGVYESTKDIFLFHSLHKLSTYLTPQTLRALVNISNIGIHKSLNKANEQSFRDPRIIQLFNRYATYNGSDPYVAPSTLSVTAHPEYNSGAYFIDGGMPDIARSLEKLARELGVRFLTSTLVEKIETDKGKATGVYANGVLHRADIVVSNMDVNFTYKKLLKEQPAPESINSQRLSSSAIIFYWGMKGTFTELDMHNIFFSADYHGEFVHLRKKEVPDDPTVYVFISSKLQKKHAPEGCENWFTLINSPNDTGQDWDKAIAEARKNIIAKLSRALGRDIAPLIISETVNHPCSIRDKTLSCQGALYGASSNEAMSAFLRHPNFSRRIDNLYFCGGSVHPGGGVPLCLLSAKIIDELIA